MASIEVKYLRDRALKPRISACMHILRGIFVATKETTIGRVRVSRDRPIDRSTDRPTDRSIEFFSISSFSSRSALPSSSGDEITSGAVAKVSLE